MGGGILQLVAVGVQDIYLIGNPQITFFKSAYKKYTNFTMESIVQTFDGNADFGQTCRVTIDRKGDLIKDIIFDILLPILPSGYYWTNGIGNVLIKQVDLEIGGQLIDRHYTDWLNIWSQLTIPDSKIGAYNQMIGNYSTVSSLENNSIQQLQLHVPMFFWFNRDYGMVLPLIALQYHEVSIKIYFRSLNECIRNNTINTPLSNYSFVNCRCWVDYIFLDMEERKQFAQKPHEYLIDQVQFSEDFSISNSAGNISRQLFFNHPTKEIYWINILNTYLQQNILTGNQQLNYSVTTNIETFKSGLIYLNGVERFQARPSTYFRLVQNYQYHTRYTPNYIYSYSFALYPEKQNPSGTCNLSKFTSIILSLDYTGSNNTSSSVVQRVYGVNYNIFRITSGMGGLSFSN
jgi:hypothetical protein